MATTAIILDFPEETVQLLATLVAERKRSGPVHMTQYEWVTKHPKGRAFISHINDSKDRYKYLAMPIEQLNKLIKEAYHKDFPPNQGRPRLMDLRIQVIHEALQQYAKLHQSKEAA